MSGEERFPETLVLHATTHGILPTGASGTPVQTFRLPTGVRLVRLSAVRPGICNFATEDQSNEFGADLVRRYPPGTSPSVDAEAGALQQFLGRMKEIRVFNTVGPGLGVMTDEERANPDFIDYRNQAYESISSFTAGDTLMDKAFSVGRDEGRAEPYDFKLTAINMAGQPDLFKLYVAGRRGATVTRGDLDAMEDNDIHLSEILREVIEKGVRTILLFDFTCSTYAVEDTLTARGKRAVAKALIGKGRTRRRPKTKSLTRTRKRRNGVSKTRARRVPRGK